MFIAAGWFTEAKDLPAHLWRSVWAPNSSNEGGKGGPAPRISLWSRSPKVQAVTTAISLSSQYLSAKQVTWSKYLNLPEPDFLQINNRRPLTSSCSDELKQTNIKHLMCHLLKTMSILFLYSSHNGQHLRLNAFRWSVALLPSGLFETRFHVARVALKITM